MSKTNIKPLGNRVVIKPEEAVEKTQSGIYLPEGAKEKPQSGEVLAIGTSDEIEVKVGDKVLYQKYAGTKIEDSEKQELLILEQTDILAVV